MATVLKETILKYDHDRYSLQAWVIMPNHGHIMIRPHEGYPLEKIMHSIKSFTASEANRIIGRRGNFWMREVFDRYIRNADHYARAKRYIENNPVKAGLCNFPEDWEFSSAYRKTNE
ncbi:MAG: transposase [Pyrinomonadaceae bacterium]